MSENPGFDDFWAIFPHRRSKGHARKAWHRAINTTTANAIMTALRAQIAAGMFSDDKHWAPHPATWLNGERWDDDVIARQRPQFRNGAAELLAREMNIGPAIEEMPAHMLEGPAGD